MDAKHTPGPWKTRINPDYFQRTVYCNRWNSNPGKKTICTVRPYPRTDKAWGEAEANARLIAAAPDLLEALIMVRDANRDEPHIPSTALASIEYAIRRATEGD